MRGNKSQNQNRNLDIQDDLLYDNIYMIKKSINGTPLNAVSPTSKNQQKKNDLFGLISDNLRESDYGNPTIRHYSVDLPQKKSKFSLSSNSIHDLKQQIHKLRKESVNLSYSPLAGRSISCMLSRQNTSTKNSQIKNSIIQIIKTQRQPKINKRKELLPGVVLHKYYQQQAMIRNDQDKQMQPKASDAYPIYSAAYPIYSVVKVKTNIQSRLNKLSQITYNQRKKAIKQTFSRWQPSQIQQPSLCQLSNID